MDDSAPPQPAEQPVPTHQPRPIDNAWWAVLLMLLVLLGIVGTTYMIWGRAAGQGVASIEHYLPLASGSARSMRLVANDGTTTYQSGYFTRQQGLAGLNLLPVEAQAQVVATTLGISVQDLTADQYGSFLKQQSGDVLIAREVLTSYAATGPLTTTTALYLVQDTRLQILAINDLLFTPAPVVLDTAFAPGQSQTTSGMLGQNLPYTLTVQLEAREAIDSSAGHLDDCLRVLQSVFINDTTTIARVWYCAGTGEARQETLDTTGKVTERIELLHSSLRPIAEPVDQLPVRDPSITASSTRVVVPEQNKTIGPAWAFVEPGTITAHVTSPATLSSSHFYFGTVDGRVVAVDRQSHQASWHFATGGSIYGAPAVGQGYVLVGSNDRRVYALDAQSGAFQWSFQTKDMINASPVIAGDRVYIGSEDGHLYALDLVTGTERWQFAASGPFASTVLVDQGVVYAGNDDGTLYALDAASGVLRWAFVTESAIESTPLVDRQTLYVGSRDSTVYALSTTPTGRDGEVLWTRNVGASISVDLLLANQTVIVQNSDDEVYALDAATGAVRWRYGSEKALRGAPLWFGDLVLVNQTGQVVGLNQAGQPTTLIDAGTAAYASMASDGREIVLGHRNGYVSVIGDIQAQPWQTRPVAIGYDLQSELYSLQDTIGTGGIAYGDSTIYVTLNGRVYRVQADTAQHELLGQITDYSGVLLPLNLAGDTLITGDQYGTVLAYDLAARRERWRVSLGGRSFSQPGIVDGKVLLASTNSHQVLAVAVDLESGTEIWRKQLPFALGVGSSALVYENRFYLVSDTVTALDPQTGDVIWAESGGLVPYQIAAADSVIYAVVYDLDFTPHLASFDAASGAVQVGDPLALPNIPLLHGGIAAGDGTVMLALNGGSLVALDAASRSLRWSTTTPAAIAGTPQVHGSSVIYATTNSRLLAQRLSDGQIIGDVQLQDANGSLNESTMQPTIVGDRLYVAFYQLPFELVLAAGGTP